MSTTITYTVHHFSFYLHKSQQRIIYAYFKINRLAVKHSSALALFSTYSKATNPIKKKSDLIKCTKLTENLIIYLFVCSFIYQK